MADPQDPRNLTVAQTAVKSVNVVYFINPFLYLAIEMKNQLSRDIFNFLWKLWIILE